MAGVGLGVAVDSGHTKNDFVLLRITTDSVAMRDCGSERQEQLMV